MILRTLKARKEDNSLFSKERLIALSDGVFAIAMTLLVLDIRLPDNPDPVAGFLSLYPHFISYVISFVVSARYWWSHHSLMHQVRQIDGAFARWSMLFLFFVTLLPVSTSFFAEHTSIPLMIAFYTGNLAACGLGIAGMSLYAASRPGILIETSNQSEIASLARKNFWAASVFLLSLIVMFLPNGTHYAYYDWILFPFIGPITHFVGNRLIKPLMHRFSRKETTKDAHVSSLGDTRYSNTASTEETSLSAVSITSAETPVAHELLSNGSKTPASSDDTGDAEATIKLHS